MKKLNWPARFVVQLYPRGQFKIGSSKLVIDTRESYNIFNPLTGKFEQLPFYMCSMKG